jgi:NADH-quinone oxidoreductase subunit H
MMDWLSAVNLDGLAAVDFHWLGLVLELMLMPLIAFVVGLGLVLMLRKIAARLQRRVGPPLLQPLWDIIKLHAKETQTSHGLIHEIGIVMAIGGYVAAVTLLPVPGILDFQAVLDRVAKRDQLTLRFTVIPDQADTAMGEVESRLQRLAALENISLVLELEKSGRIQQGKRIIEEKRA